MAFEKHETSSLLPKSCFLHTYNEPKPHLHVYSTHVSTTSKAKVEVL